ncbi:MAG: hypothetical protein ABI634_12845 [Acidobacteriota bacterium]
MIWTVSTLAVTCGNCCEVIPADAPIALVSTAKKVRCAPCAAAMGFPVDQAEVDLERFRLEAESVPTRIVRPAQQARVPPVRQPVPLSAVAGSFFDSKAAASGGRNDQ